MDNSLLRRLGTVDADIVEANPVVFRNRLYRFEYIRKGVYCNSTDNSFFRMIDVASGQTAASFGAGYHMGCAFVCEDTVYVSCTDKWGGHGIYLFSSRDLLNWSGPELILNESDRGIYNTSVCRSGNGFSLVYELDNPETGDQVFTMYFAYSADMIHWEKIPDAVYGKGIYCGAPMLRCFDGYYYLFHLAGCYEEGFDTMVVRSRDLVNWSFPRLVLSYSDTDRKWQVEPPETLRKKAEQTVNINVSDLDFCDFEGKLYATFSWGDQAGNEFLATGEADCTEKEFCLSFWQNSNE